MSDRRADYAYPLDESLIATRPPDERSGGRLMFLDAVGSPPSHHAMRDLPSLLREGDLLVVNVTKVIPARLRVRKESGGAVELLIVEFADDGRARALARSSKPLRPGQPLLLPAGEPVRVLQASGPEHWDVQFPGDVLATLHAHGEVPLPPYMHRAPDAADVERYQTVFAREPGSCAAPTAGLHLDAGLLALLESRGIFRAEVTLHVGPGTFMPVRADALDDHVMHQERYAVPAATVDAVVRTRAAGGRIVAVGTTSVRALESAAHDGVLTARGGDTRLFIRPGYPWRVVDVLLTNFHLPESTLLMLVCALAGRDRVLDAYSLAQQHRYRFFSYGDAMLVERPR